ncbi:MAG: MurR/RpiR family transcriptional regulator [Butyrivibrio sp.]|jgi:DNA-binding MurR/RpiR family transcriptional regulator|nr:MurR/RpiR family transcriptional regulator [Butyrivibrio sp.]
MKPMSGIKMEIVNKYDSMTSVERGIADFFIRNEKIMDFSSKNISKILYTSEATLSRFAKKCGYKGYREFVFGYEKEVTEELQEHNISILTRKVRNTYSRLLDNSFQILDEEQIRRVAGLMSSCSKTIVAGMGSSGYAAREFQLRFMRLGMEIQAVTDAQMIPMTVALCSETSLVIAISLSGCTREILDAVRLAKTKSAKIVMITANLNTEVAGLCDELIAVAATRNLDDGTAISPQFPILVLIDIFYTYYSENDAQRKLSNYHETLQALRGESLRDDELYRR